MTEVRKGAIARCSRGHLGLITGDPRLITYDDGEKGLAWMGIHLEEPYLGEQWSSRSPTVLGCIEELIGELPK